MKCTFDHLQRSEVVQSIEDRYRKTREAIRKGTKTEITALRDMMYRAHPGLQDTVGAGRLIVAADPPKIDESDETGQEAGKMPADDTSSIPPEWAMTAQDEKTSTDQPRLSPDRLREQLMALIPFDDDIQIWEMLQKPGAFLVLIEILDGDLPADVGRETSSSNYADHVITSLFSDSYIEDHLVPEKGDQPPGEEYSPAHTMPSVPKTLLAVLHAIAVRHSNEKFNVNTFWTQVRAHFPEMCKASSGSKPSATCMYQEAQASVTEEDLAAKAAKTKSASAYATFIRQMKEYRSSEDDSSPDPPPAAHDVAFVEPSAAAGGVDATTEDESFHLRKRVESKVTTSTSKSGGRVTRKRQENAAMEESEVDLKKSKKN